MADSPRQHLLDACRRLMRPVVRLLLRSGVMHREFVELCKELYVDIASRDFGLRGRPTNASRVALLSGLDRKEIRRLRELLADCGSQARRAAARTDRLSRVLSGWFQDPDFSTQGRPLALEAVGQGASFAQLVQRYGGDVPASAVLKELKRVGAVEVDGSVVRAQRRYYMPSQSAPEALERTASVLADLGDTVVHNLYRASGAPSRFEGRATNVQLERRAVEQFRKFVEVEGQRFLEKVDAWLTAHEAADAKDAERVRLGLGLYWIQSEAGRGGNEDVQSE